MAKFTNYIITPEVRETMGKLLAKFPHYFAEDFNVERIKCILTMGKKNSNTPIKVHRIRYPFDVLDDNGYVFIFEVFDRFWKRMNQNQRNFAVMHSMKHIANGAFTDNNHNYGKLIDHEHEVFRKEVSKNGKVIDWMYDEKTPDVFEMEDVEEDTNEEDVVDVEDVEEDQEGDEDGQKND